jgi:Domain of unknown function (DUF5925)/ATPase family associated with various cellular activities (AAA)
MDETQTLSAKELVLGIDYEAGSAYLASYLQLIVSRGLPHERRVTWDTTAANVDGLLESATHSSKFGRGSGALLDLEAETGCLAVVWVASGVATSHLAAETVDALVAGESLLRRRLPERVATEDQTVPMAFWSYARYGPSETSRSIGVPTWTDIRGNYPVRVAAQLEPLMSPEYRPDGRGQLILWYGEPGTGKTYSLRALGWQWREWCAFHYVTDPETFFGRPDYMLQVILEGDDDDEEEQKWKLLILEDTGELLAADAKVQAGQGLSRLLNVVDGIIGQGLRVIVLVTTNDDLRQLHPAVSRPGRCLAKVEFVSFTPEEAEEWLARNGVDRDGHAGTLASLFGTAAGEHPLERPPIGFAR